MWNWIFFFLITCPHFLQESRYTFNIGTLDPSRGVKKTEKKQENILPVRLGINSTHHFTYKIHNTYNLNYQNPDKIYSGSILRKGLDEVTNHIHGDEIEEKRVPRIKTVL